MSSRSNSDVVSVVGVQQCSRYVEDEFPQARGAKKSPTSKYLLGGGVLAFVIAIIWFPLVFFAFGNTVTTFTLYGAGPASVPTLIY